MTWLEGSIVDLVTPFKGDGIDERGFTNLVEWQISEGSNGLATGTATGEGPTLSALEKERLIRICVEVSGRRVPVVAATGTNGTDSTIALTRMAKAAGADAALVVTPYYNRPSQEGIYRHFEAVARAVDIPIVVHNVPTRTGVDLLPGTLGRLSRIAPIVGLCDPGADPLRPLAVARATNDRLVLLCGEDARAVAFNLAAGRGCLSALANLLPGPCAALQRASLDGRHGMAGEIHRRLAGLMEALGSDAGPVLLKAAMPAVRSGFETSCRLPMVSGPPFAERAVTAALESVLGDPFAEHFDSGQGPSCQRAHGHLSATRT